MKSSQEAVSSYLVATCSLFYITLVKSCHEMNELLLRECSTPVVRCSWSILDIACGLEWIMSNTLSFQRKKLERFHDCGAPFFFQEKCTCQCESVNESIRTAIVRCNCQSGLSYFATKANSENKNIETDCTYLTSTGLICNVAIYFHSFVNSTRP